MPQLAISRRRRSRKSRTLRVSVLQRGGMRGNHSAIIARVEAAARRLMSTRMVNLLTIRVELRAPKLPAKTHGQMFSTLTGCKAKRHFVIQVQRDATLCEQLSTIDHEVCHVAQFAAGRLQLRFWATDRTWHVRWAGKKMGRFGEQVYVSSPWEIEARQFERTMMTHRKPVSL